VPPASRPLPAVADRVRALLTPEPPEDPTAPATVAEVLGGASYSPGRRGALALVAVAVVAALVGGVVLLRGRSAEQPLVVPAAAGDAVSTAGPQLVIDVEGSVRHPGLVRLPDGARVDDALRAAGGVLRGASTTGLNLARKLTDGEQVVVGAPAASAPGGGASATAGGLLDLNLATAQDLDALPGIGPVLAQRIVDWRTEHGRFASVDQLREVDGIGESKYAQLKAKVRV
jgi:competence protein ComEA